MQPRPIADASGPFVPSLRCSICAINASRSCHQYSPSLHGRGASTPFFQGVLVHRRRVEAEAEAGRLRQQEVAALGDELAVDETPEIEDLVVREELDI